VHKGNEDLKIDMMIFVLIIYKTFIK